MKKGFTLIELLIVTVVVGTLMGIAVPKFSIALERGRSAEGFNFIQHVAGDLNAYYMAHEKYPEEAEDLAPYEEEDGEFFRNYPILKHFTLPSPKPFQRENDAHMKVSVERGSSYKIVGYLDHGNLTGFECVLGTDAKAARFCQAIGFRKQEANYVMPITPNFMSNYNEAD